MVLTIDPSVLTAFVPAAGVAATAVLLFVTVRTLSRYHSRRHNTVRLNWYVKKLASPVAGVVFWPTLAAVTWGVIAVIGDAVRGTSETPTSHVVMTAIPVVTFITAFGTFGVVVNLIHSLLVVWEEPEEAWGRAN